MAEGGRGRGRRLVGVDVARGLALLGMMAVHVLPAVDEDGGGTSLAHDVASGRSAALFAVLAGVGLAFGRPSRPALLVRAAGIGLVGLLLGELDSGVAVILAYYALLFVVALPLLRWPAQRLAATAALVALAVPVVSWVVRDHLPRAPSASPSLDSLGEPLRLLQTLLLTGYYPVLAWTAYLCAGLAVGRLLARSDPRLPWALLGGGVVLALAASAGSSVLLGPLGGLEEIAATLPGGADAEQVVEEHRFGTVPTSTPWWLAVDAPHSTTPPDLLHTTGTALAVLGAMLLVRGRPLTPLAAAGSMPLTLYTLHVAALGPLSGLGPTTSYTAQVVAALLLATLWRRRFGRGPLEALLARGTRLVTA